jgi:hypothetical protein
LSSGNIKEDFTITKSVMAETLERTIKQITIDSIRTLTDSTQVSNQITDKAKEKLGGNWHCIIYKGFCGIYCIRNNEGKYIHFSVSDYNFIIFQTRD